MRDNMNKYGNRGRWVTKSSSSLLVALLCVCVQFILAVFGFNSIYCDILSIVLYSAMLYTIYRKDTLIISKYLLFVVMSTWSVVAVFFLENGDVVLRGKHSEHFGSLTVYVLGWLVFYFVIVFYELAYQKKAKKINYTIQTRDFSQRTWKILTYISCLAIILVTGCFLSVCTKPYFLLGIDRFAYSQGGYLSSFVSNMEIWLFALVPVVLIQRKRKKWIPISYLLIFALLLIWIGEKFTGLIILVYFMLLSINPVYVSAQLSNKVKKLLKTFVMIVLGLIITVYINQVAINGVDFSGFLNYFGDRVAAQGELWWLTYEQDYNKGIHLDEIGDELDVLINQPKTSEMSTYDFGIYKLMKKFMKSDWVTYALGINVRATESTRAEFFYYGKTGGLIVGQALLALLICLVVNMTIKQCNKGNWVAIICSMYVLRTVSNASLMSDFQLLTTKRIILVYIIILLSTHFKFKLRTKSSLRGLECHDAKIS